MFALFPFPKSKQKGTFEDLFLGPRPKCYARQKQGRGGVRQLPNITTLHFLRQSTQFLRCLTQNENIILKRADNLSISYDYVALLQYSVETFHHNRNVRQVAVNPFTYLLPSRVRTRSQTQCKRTTNITRLQQFEFNKRV